MVCVTGRETVGTFQAKDGTTQISRDIAAFNIDFVNAGNGGSEAQTTETTVTTEPVISTGKLAEKPSVEKTSKAAVDDLPF
jgi:single-stranded DNA-binding protein